MAKHDELTLSIAKIPKNPNFLTLKYGSSERGKTLEVTVLDTDNKPYDLSDLGLVFVDEKHDGNIIVDDGKQEKSGKFTPIDLKNGKFSYTFQEKTFGYDGWAHFRITKNKEVIDTTDGFAIDIIQEADSEYNLGNEQSYISELEEIKEAQNKFETSTRTALDSLQKSHDANKNEIEDVKKSLSEWTKKFNQQLTDATTKWTNDLNTKADKSALKNSDKLISELQKNLSTLTQTVNTKANDSDLQSAKKLITTISGQISQLKTSLDDTNKKIENKSIFKYFSSAEEARANSNSDQYIAVFDPNHKTT